MISEYAKIMHIYGSHVGQRLLFPIVDVISCYDAIFPENVTPSMTQMNLRELLHDIAALKSIHT